MRLLYNTSNRKKKYNSIDLEKQINEWIFTPLIRNKHKDIIICPIQHIWEDIQTNIIDIGQNHIKESQMFETNDLIYCSYHPWVTEISKDLRIDPVIRKWMLSRINDGTIYMDWFTFPGNSGSAVYMKPTETKTWWEFVGIISGYIPYRDIATSNQTGNTRVIFEENTGLTIVYTMKYINAMLQSKTMKQSLQKIKKHLAKHA